jgi:hypothetical protein
MRGGRREAGGRPEYRTGWPVNREGDVTDRNLPVEPASTPAEAKPIACGFHAGAPSACGFAKSTQSMTVPIRQTCLGSPRAADHPGIHVTSQSGQIIRLPTPGAPGVPQFRHPPGSASCWPPLIRVCHLPHSYLCSPVPCGLPQQPRAQIPRPGEGSAGMVPAPLRTTGGTVFPLMRIPGGGPGRRHRYIPVTADGSAGDASAPAARPWRTVSLGSPGTRGRPGPGRAARSAWPGDRR